jgi:CHAT domain-containing protein
VWTKRYDEISGKLASIGRELGELRKKQETQPLSLAEQKRIDDLEKDLEVANRAFDSTLGKLIAGLEDIQSKQSVSDKADDTGSRQGTLEELGAGTVLLQYLVLNDKVSILLTTPTVRLAREGKVTQAELNRLIAAYRETLRNPKLDPTPQAHALYQFLIAPVASDLQQAQAKVIMLSLDGTLRYLPFAALYDGQHYLVEQYALSLYNEAAADKLKDKNSGSWKVWGMGVTQAHPGFTALGSVKGELDGIVGQAGLNGQIWLDEAFNEQTLKNGVVQRYPVLHIASHFNFSPGTLSDSYLLLGDSTHLSLQDVKVKFNFTGVDLITLSACETGFGGGQDINGREVEGLGAIMQKKGAKSVMATLWSVEDSSTAQLMQNFYHLRQQQNLNKAEALRNAQLALLRGSTKVEELKATTVQRGGKLAIDGKIARTDHLFFYDPDVPFAHPFYWAPFILMGNWL